jgi:signal transduction histidine kinase
VTVRLQRTKTRAVVHVADTGKGIRPQAVPHVFDAYYSCDPYGDTDERPGDGLGLYLVRQGLRAMGGECAMESEFGRGTQLSFALPLAEEQQTAVHARLAEYLLDRFSCAYIHFCPLGARLWP